MENKKEPYLSVNGITKEFPGVIANDNVYLNFYKSEIHTILGENGAGKSTLMKIVSGFYKQDKGEILLNGSSVNINSPKEAFNLGIGMVYQDFMLVKRLTVIENIILGQEGSIISLDKNDAKKRIKEISNTYNLPVHLHSPVGDLSVGEQQRVEIIRLLFRNSDILIFDEPTAVLTPQESDRLGEMLEILASEGRVIIYITHKIKEAMKISNKITIMRAGKVVRTIRRSNFNEKEIINLMIGEKLTKNDLIDAQKINLIDAQKIKKMVLKVKNVHMNKKSFSESLKGINLNIFTGEIVGIAGISGNGQRQIAQGLTGLEKIDSGEIFINGVNISNLNPRDIILEGVSYIPGDRLDIGLVGSLPVSDNLILKGYRRPEFHKGGLLNRKNIESFSKNRIKEFKIKVPDFEMPVILLSGGNQQKVILARELFEPHNLLIAEHPTRGLDIKAIADVHNFLLHEKAKGTAIMLITSDLDELLALSDRIYVIREGNIVGEISSDEADPKEIGYLMTGDIEKVAL